MQKQNIIVNSLKESFTKIWQNKFLFFLLLVLQIIFFAIFSAISLNYQTKILENAKAITDYIDEQKLDEASAASKILQKKSILGDDPLSISRNFNEIKKNFRYYLIFTFILSVASISTLWTLTIKLIHNYDFKHSAKIFLKIFAVSFFYLSLIFSFFFSLLNISVIDAATESAKIFTKYIPFLIFSVVLAYFMLISISLLQNTELKNIVQRTLIIGIKKGHYVLSVYAINIFLVILPAFLLYRFIEENLFVLFLSLALMIFSFVFGRIFLVNAIKNLY